MRGFPCRLRFLMIMFQSRLSYWETEIFNGLVFTRIHNQSFKRKNVLANLFFLVAILPMSFSVQTTFWLKSANSLATFLYFIYYYIIIIRANISSLDFHGWFTTWKFCQNLLLMYVLFTEIFHTINVVVTSRDRDLDYVIIFLLFVTILKSSDSPNVTIVHPLKKWIYVL